MKVEGKWRKRGRVGDSTLRTVTQKRERKGDREQVGKERKKRKSGLER